MDSYWVAAASACWLGILTSISPCPLATNIAAISYIGKRVDRPRMVIFSGIIYTTGRVVSYVTLGFLIVASALSIPELSFFLQKYMNLFLGPLLLITSLFLLEVIRVSLPGIGLGEKLRQKVDRYGIWGAGILGLLFALSFCPVSAALYFGSLIPLAVKHHSSVLMPAAYAVGTALPVVLFSALIAVGARVVGKAFHRLSQIERWARRITGVVFLLVGIYYCLTYLFHIEVW